MIGEPTDLTKQQLAPRTHWSEMSGTDHFVQLYESDDYLLESLKDYVETGLLVNEVCIVVATEGHRDGLSQRMRAAGLDVGSLVAEGRYVPLDASELLATFIANGTPSQARFDAMLEPLLDRARRQSGEIRIFGEMVALLWREGNQAGSIELERLWNELRQRHEFALFCAYPMSDLEGETLGEQLRHVCELHSGVVPSESYSDLATVDQRLREIALLQQRASSLEAEVERRRQAEEELRRALELRDEFLSAVSHDLKTPLTVLQGQAQVLQRRAARGQLDEATLAKGLEQIESRSRLMARVIDELVDVTRVRAGEDHPPFDD